MLRRTVLRAVATQSKQYVPYRWLVHRVIEHGCAGTVAPQQLLGHPEAPPPWDVMEALVTYSYLDSATASAIIEASTRAVLDQRRAGRSIESPSAQEGKRQHRQQHTQRAYTVYPGEDGSPSGAPLDAVRRSMTPVDGLEYVAREILSCPRLRADGEVLDVLCRALLIAHSRDQASSVFMLMRNCDVSYDTWSALVNTARLNNTAAVERLMALDEFPLSWDFPAAAAANLMLWGGPSGGRVKAVVALRVMQRYMARHVLDEHGVPLPRNRVPLPTDALPADVEVAVRTIRLWSSASDSSALIGQLRGYSGGSPSPALSLHRRRRRRASLRDDAQRDAQRAWGVGIEKPAPPDPVPLRVFFDICRQRVKVGDDNNTVPTLHWRIMWRSFQLLNRCNPSWFTAESGTTPDDAEQLIFLVIDVLTRGATPWLAFHLAHVASREGIVDGVDVAMYLLLRTHRGQYVTEGSRVARIVFDWLLGTAEIYKRPERRPAVINACRVLIHLGMQQELAQLYDLVIDNAAEADAKFRSDLLKCLTDVVCPSCNSMLSNNNPHVERTCDVCGTVVAARPEDELPSFELSEEARQRARGKKAQLALERGKKLKDSVDRLRGKHRGDRAPKVAALPAPEPRHANAQGTGTAAAPGDLLSAPAQDAAERFRERVLSTPLVVAPSGLSLPTNLLAPEEIATLVSQQSADESDVAASAMGTSSSITAVAAVPSLAVSSGGSPSSMADSLAAPSSSASRPWTCCWCDQKMTSLDPRDACVGCGAVTGPAAAWRQPFVDPENGRIDPIADFRERVACVKRTKALDVALGAGFHLLVYRRAFAMRATKEAGDYALLLSVVSFLSRHGQRVMAAAVYFGLLPEPMRRLDDTLAELSACFGRFDRKVLFEQAAPVLRQRRELMRVVLGEDICPRCFGVHPATSCPLVTRDFAKTSTRGGATPEEEQLSPTKRLLYLLSRMDVAQPASITTAYAAFLTFEDREEFARLHAPEANFLALMLRQIDHVKRAALVACHLPLHDRSNDVLRGLCTGFAVDVEDYEGMLGKRQQGDRAATHPNFVQLTRTCCMCFDDQHAASSCPRLQHWLHDCAVETPSVDAFAFAPVEGIAKVAQSKRPFGERARAAVAGWVSSGPERLLAFTRFLLQRIDDVGMLATKCDVVAETLNLCIVKLAVTGQESQAYRLYARTPLPVVARATTASLLRVRGFADDIVKQGLQSAATGSDWNLMALPPNACLLCFRDDHTCHGCPELQYLSTTARWVHIINNVASFKLSNVGVLSAAQALCYDAAAGVLNTRRLRESSELAKAVAKLITKCFTAGLPRYGVALMRILPASQLTTSLHLAMWRSAGKSSDVIERDLPALQDSVKNYQEGVAHYTETLQTTHALPAPSPPKDATPARESSSAPSSPKPRVVRGGGVGRARASAKSTDTAAESAAAEAERQAGAARAAAIAQARKGLFDAQADYRRCLTQNICHRCLQSGHEAISCDFHAAEVTFGRDLLSAFRVIAMDEIHFKPEQTYECALNYARFIAEYHRQLPYHISSVTRAANAIAALLAMMDCAPAAMRLLMYIPACYRASHVYCHILGRFAIPLDQIERLLSRIETPADPDQEGNIGPEKTTLSIPPMSDTAMEKVFSVLPNPSGILASGEHLLAAKDITNPSEPTSIVFAQHAALHELSEALLERIIEPLEAATGTKVGSRLQFIDANIEEGEFDLLDEPPQH